MAPLGRGRTWGAKLAGRAVRAQSLNYPSDFLLRRNRVLQGPGTLWHQLYVKPTKSSNTPGKLWNAWKSAEAKKPAWNRAKVSIAAGCLLGCCQVLKLHDTRSTQAQQNQRIPYLKNYKNPWAFTKSMKLYINLRSILMSWKTPWRQDIHENLCKSMQIH